MKKKKSRLDLIMEYELAPDWVWFSQETIAAIRDVSVSTIERDRWAGNGVKFKKVGHLIRYEKAEIKKWLREQQSFSSTVTLRAS